MNQQDLDRRLGALQDAVDDLRLRISTLHTRVEELLTQVDLALRDILVSIDQKVGEINAKADVLNERTKVMIPEQKETGGDPPASLDHPSSPFPHTMRR